MGHRNPEVFTSKASLRASLTSCLSTPMATLTRPRSLSAQAQIHTHSLIDSHVPSPFPTQILQREREREQQEEVPAAAPEEIAHEDPFVDQNEESGVNISVSVESVESEAAHSRNGSHEQDGESAEVSLR